MLHVCIMHSLGNTILNKVKMPRILRLSYGTRVTKNLEHTLTPCGRHGGLMVRALVPWVSGPGSSPGQRHCVVFLGKTPDSHSASLHPGVYMGTGKLLGKPNKLLGNNLRWTSIPSSRGSRNTPSRFMLQKLGINSGAMSQSPLRLHFFSWHHAHSRQPDCPATKTVNVQLYFQKTNLHSQAFPKQ